MLTLHSAESADQVSPLVLADRLISLAEEADRAGYAGAASRLVKLACSMVSEKPHMMHS